MQAQKWGRQGLGSFGCMDETDTLEKIIVHFPSGSFSLPDIVYYSEPMKERGVYVRK